MKYTINRNNNPKNYKQQPRGFILALAMVILSVVLTISIAVTIVLMRDLNSSTTNVASHTAYYFADAVMTCALSYERTIRNQNDNSTGVFPVSMNSLDGNSNYKFNDFNTPSTLYTPEGIKCLDSPLFSNINSSSNNKTTIKTVDEVGGSTIYRNGGVRYQTTIQNQEMSSRDFNRACVILEVYGKAGEEKLFITKGQVPCGKADSVERVIVRKVI